MAADSVAVAIQRAHRMQGGVIVVRRPLVSAIADPPPDGQRFLLVGRAAARDFGGQGFGVVPVVEPVHRDTGIDHRGVAQVLHGDFKVFRIHRAAHVDGVLIFGAIDNDGEFLRVLLPRCCRCQYREDKRKEHRIPCCTHSHSPIKRASVARTCFVGPRFFPR